ncbi:MAG: DHH family phosphoesterase [Candidatus Methanoplasma sp.]|jgi:RecJ-like exonuclease|nr:DHH family phosphoesterase [Candidatus Methanoplasma sp.]
MDGAVPPKLLTVLSHAADIVRSHDFIHVFSHYDADGISAASIVAKTLARAGKEFSVRLFTTLDDEAASVIRGSGAECVVVTDLGASYVKEFDAMPFDVVVFDHHTVGDEAQRICYANPHLHGIDGMTSGCGATMAFLFAIAMDESNWDLVQVAMAGIAGDRQHINGLLGLNSYLLSEGKKRSLVKVSEGSLIPCGRLKDSLFISTDPYVRGVSGNEDGVRKILSEAGVSGDKDFSELSPEEAQRLSSSIALRLAAQNVSLQAMFETARTRYHLPDWKMDAETFATLLNGCGRTGLEGLGVCAAMGDAECLEGARRMEAVYSRQVLEAVVALDGAGTVELENIQWFDSSASGFTGVVCGVAMQFIGNPGKPVIGVNRSGDSAKVSSRGTWALLDRGVDLSAALKRACEAVGGNGGGHKIASGGSFPSARTEEFLHVLDKIIGEQVSAK